MLAMELMRCDHQFKYNFEDEAIGFAKQMNTYGAWWNEMSPWILNWITGRTMLPFTDIKKDGKKKNRLR